MLRDAWLVMMKEYREVLLRMGSLKANLLNLFLVVGVFGVFMPVQAGAEWVDNPLLVFAWAWLPLFLVSALVADSFAGERERHTLETLLASRLSDTSILMGKLAAAVLYGYGMLLVVMAVSLVSVNVAAGSWSAPLLYPVSTVVGVVLFGFLGTLLLGAVGVTVSLKAQTVRQAGQALSLGMLALIWLPGLVATYAFSVLAPERQEALVLWFDALDTRAIALAAALALCLLDAVFVAIATARFKRARLILD